MKKLFFLFLIIIFTSCSIQPIGYYGTSTPYYYHNTYTPTYPYYWRYNYLTPPVGYIPPRQWYFIPRSNCRPNTTNTWRRTR